MPDHQWENSIRIADYLEDRLSPSEEEAFMQALGEDEELRRQYEEELVIKGRMGGAEVRDMVEAAMLQPADEHLRMVGEILVKDKEVRKTGEGGKIALFGRSGMVAAALLVVIAGMVLYIRIGRRGSEEQVVKRVVKADTGVLKNGEAAQPTKRMRWDSLYTRLYEPYRSGDDPVEVSLYYQDYKKGDYGAVLAAREVNYQVMGAGGREGVLKRYMLLYKGLSYLAIGKPVAAIGMLEKVPPEDASYRAAQWYLALAWLKQGELEKARSIAKKIAHSPSRYREEAERLLRDLGS